MRRRASGAGIETAIGFHTFRATGITDNLTNGGRIEVAQRMAGHSNAKSTGPYDRRNDDISVGEVERIGFDIQLFSDRKEGTMSEETGKIMSVISEVTVYPSSGENSLLFRIPVSVLRALELPEPVSGEHLYVVVRDIFGNLIHHRRVQLTSGPEVKKSDFANQISTGQLYPGQRIRLEVSLPEPEN